MPHEPGEKTILGVGNSADGIEADVAEDAEGVVVEKDERVAKATRIPDVSEAVRAQGVRRQTESSRHCSATPSPSA